MKRLRSKGGCPWDRKQTLKSLKDCILEEAHELMHAIDLNEKEKLLEELGDMYCVLGMIVAVGEERRLFSKEALVRSVQRKMISRHPHVFGNEKARTAQEALRHFQAVKDGERREKKNPVLGDLNEPFPALMLAQKMQRRVARIGFDWPNVRGAFDKVREELLELGGEIRRGGKTGVREEIGDLLFAVVNLARKLGIESETALFDANKKFRKRFEKLEVSFRGRKPPYDLKEMDELWERIKRGERR